MTLKEFTDYTKGRNTDDTVRYKDEVGILYWGELGDICWQHDDGDEMRNYRFGSDKEFLESPCFWGKRLEEIVSDLTIDGYEAYQLTHCD